MGRSNLVWLGLGVGALAMAGCSKPAEKAPETTAAAVVAESPAVVEPTYPTRAWFGDTHVHTGWSADAGLDGAITSPEDAFRMARGEEVKSNTGQMAQLRRPLDWMVITDHSDGMGTINEIRAGNPEMLADPTIKRWSEAMNSGDEKRNHAAVLEAIDLQSNGKLPAQLMNPKWMVSAWEKTVAIADKYNEPGKFTALIGYEWTVNAGGGDNLHRNIIYRDGADKAKAMLPLTTFQTQDPEKLWQWMSEYEAKTGGRLLAIPHNGNLSNGRMFEETTFTGGPMTRAYAEARAKWEPLFEVTQIKGQSESHPSLSPNDEFSSWDLWDRGNLNGEAKKPGMYRTEYWREALKSGLKLDAALGANPFKYGANAATDTHTGLPTADEDNFWGKFKGTRAVADAMEAVGDRRRQARLDLRLGAGRLRLHGRVGGRQYAGVAVGCHEAPRDLCDHGAAHDRALLRRLRLQRRRRRGPRQGGLHEGRSDGWRPAGVARRQGADVPDCGNEGSRGRQPRSRPGDQGLARGRWQDLREGLRREMVWRSRARSRRQAAAGRQHGRREDGDLSEQHRRSRTGYQLVRSGLRPEAQGRLLRAGARDPDAAVDRLRHGALQVHDAGQGSDELQERAFTSPIWYMPAT